MNFQVIVSGSVWYESTDELCANAIATSIRKTGWKHVRVVPVKI